LRNREYTHWTRDETAELRRLAGLRVSAIARHLGRTVSSVRNKASLEGISLKPSQVKMRQILADTTGATVLAPISQARTETPLRRGSADRQSGDENGGSAR
jgi:hypothetical protein